jgi:hypothetical protein
VCIFVQILDRVIRGAGTGCYSVCTASDGCLSAAGVGITVCSNDGTTWHFTPSNPAGLVSQLRTCPDIGPAKIILGTGGHEEAATLDEVLATAPVRYSDWCVVL